MAIFFARQGVRWGKSAEAPSLRACRVGPEPHIHEYNPLPYPSPWSRLAGPESSQSPPRPPQISTGTLCHAPKPLIQPLIQAIQPILPIPIVFFAFWSASGSISSSNRLPNPHPNPPKIKFSCIMFKGPYKIISPSKYWKNLGFR